jgi:hypothetical protein
VAATNSALAFCKPEIAFTNPENSQFRIGSRTGLGENSEKVYIQMTINLTTCVPFMVGVRVTRFVDCFLGQFFENYKSRQHFWASFPHN